MRNPDEEAVRRLESMKHLEVAGVYRGHLESLCGEIVRGESRMEPSFIERFSTMAALYLEELQATGLCGHGHDA
jgi:hypothetical protein